MCEYNMLSCVCVCVYVEDIMLEECVFCAALVLKDMLLHVRKNDEFTCDA